MGETIVKTIGDSNYYIAQLGVKEARRIGRRLAKVFAVSAEAELKAEKFFEVLTDEEFDFLCDTFAKSTTVSPADSPIMAQTGQPEKMWPLMGRMDAQFSGHLGLLMQWLKACVEVNFGNFLDDLGPELKEMLLTLAAKSAETETTAPAAVLIGSSGASSMRASGPSTK